MGITRSLAAAGHALFEALLAGDAARAQSLLHRSTNQAIHTGTCGFTSLHAAVVGGCADAPPALVAAGAPLDATLQSHGTFFVLVRFMESFGEYTSEQADVLRAGFTPLALAARYVRRTANTLGLHCNCLPGRACLTAFLCD
jgi:hypothetical protein